MNTQYRQAQLKLWIHGRLALLGGPALGHLVFLIDFLVVLLLLLRRQSLQLLLVLNLLVVQDPHTCSEANIDKYDWS